MTNIEVTEIPTWYELKKFCSELTGDQLGQPVHVEGSEGKFTAVSIEREGDKLLIVTP